MKLNHRYLAFGTVIIYFCDKPYQEINWGSNLISILICKWEKVLSDLYMSCLILFHSLFFVLTFLIKWKDANYESHEIFQYFAANEKWIETEYVPWKMPDFVSFPLFAFTLFTKLRNFGHWNRCRYIWICLMEKCLILFYFHCLGSL